MKFVIRDKKTGYFLYSSKSGYKDPKWVVDINNARFYERKCDASNSLTEQKHKEGRGWYRHRTALFEGTEPEVREVEVSYTLL